MNKKYCLLLGVEKNRFRCIVAAARITDLKIAIIQSNGSVQGNRFAEIVINGLEENPECALDAIKLYEKNTGYTPSAVIPLTEMTLNSGEYIAKHYNLPYLSNYSLSLARNKYLMRESANKYGINVPKFSRFSNFDELLKVSHNMTFPLILKPTNAGGSEGVFLVRNQKMLKTGFEYLSKATANFKSQYCLSDSDYLVEEFIEAKTELSVEVLNTKKSRKVLAITDKILSKLPYFVEMGHSLPSKECKNENLELLAIKVCELMQIDHGLAHIEFIIDKFDKIYLLELNARTPGGGIPEIFEKTTDVNMFSLHCASYLHDEVLVPEYRMKGFAAIGFMKAKEGVVKSIFLPKADSLPKSIFGIQLWTEVGAKVDKSYSNGDLEGFIEFYWPNGNANTNLNEYIELTKKLTDEIIIVD